MNTNATATLSITDAYLLYRAYVRKDALPKEFIARLYLEWQGQVMNRWSSLSDDDRKALIDSGELMGDDLDLIMNEVAIYGDPLIV
jgi:hypothetical protein